MTPNRLRDYRFAHESAARKRLSGRGHDQPHFDYWNSRINGLDRHHHYGHAHGTSIRDIVRYEIQTVHDTVEECVYNMLSPSMVADTWDFDRSMLPMIDAKDLAI